MPASPTPPVALLLSKLKKVKATAGGWVALCPSHEDRNHSLKVDVGKDGRALATCFAGCSFQQIVSAVGLTMADTFMDRPPTRGALALSPSTKPAPRPTPAPAAPKVDKDVRRAWPVVATYDYVDADGQFVFQVVRKEDPNPPKGQKPAKDFFQRQKGANGWVYGLEGVETRPLWRLPEIIDDLAAERTILLVEGEKACDALRAFGFPAAAHMGGANGWRAEYGAQLAGASVTILPDNDEPGRKWAAAAAESLIANGCTVKMLALPTTNEHDDIVEWIAGGGTPEKLTKLLSIATPWAVGDPVPLPPGPSRFKVLSIRDLMALPPLEWLVGEEMAGIFPASSLMAIYGPPGAGKSFIAADLACTIASRHAEIAPTWFGNTVRRGSVLYVIAEGGRGFGGRIQAWMRAHHAEWPDLALQFVAEPVNLFASEDVSHLMRAIDTMDSAPALIVFDTFARCSVGAEENSAKDVGMVIDRADRIKRETGATVGIIHHATKEGEVERGSIALRAGVDTLCLAAEDEEGGHLLTCKKQKDAEDFPPIRYYLSPVGESCIISAQPPTGPTALTANQRAALKTLAELFPKGATATEWLKGTGIPDRSFYRVRAWLQTQGYVNEWDAGRSAKYSATPSGHWAINGQVL